MSHSPHAFRGALLVLLCLIGFSVASCRGDGLSGPRGPVAGEALLTLSGAPSDDRAVLLEIGPGATGFEAGRVNLEVHSQATRDGFTVAVFGPLAGGAILRMDVEDMGNLPTVRILEVAAEDGGLRSSFDTYQVRVEVNR